MLGYSTAENIVLLIAAIAPVAFVVWFAWWFLRAGKRYDEEERAAGRRPAGLEASSAKPPTPGRKTGR